VNGPTRPWYRSRNPSTDFSSSTNEFFVTFEVQQPDLVTSDIIVATYSQSSLNWTGALQVSNAQRDRQEHAPSCGVAPNGQTLVVWTSGNWTDEKHGGSKRFSESDVDLSKSFSDYKFDPMMNADIRLRSAPSLLPMNIPSVHLEAMDVEMVEIGEVQKRFYTGNTESAVLCLLPPTTGTTGTPAGTTGFPPATTGTPRSVTTGTPAPGTTGEIPATTGPILGGTDSSATTGGDVVRSSEGGIGRGAIAAAVIIPIIACILLIVGIVLYMRWRKKKAVADQKLQAAETELSQKERSTYG
jgi:hypothetical protein